MKNNLSSSFFSKAANKLASPVKQAISSVLDSLNSQDLDEEEFIKIEQSIMVLFLYVMKADGDVSDNEIETVSNYFKENYGQGSLNRFRVLLQKKELDSIEDCCKNLESFTHSEKVDILKALINVGYSDSQFKEDEKDSVLEISKQLGIHSDDLNSALAEAEKAYRTRSSFIKSSAGLIAAFVIILIFILTATYLKSVLFGLILAYFFLPLQRWYAESFFNNGAIARFMNFLGSCKNACSKVVKGIRGIFPAKASKVVTENQEDSDESERRLQLKRSCHATVLTVILSSAAAVVLVLWISSGYFTAAKETLKEVDENKDTKPVIHNLLDRLNPNLIEIPIIAKAVEFAEEFVADEEKITELKNDFLEKRGGLLGVITTVLGGLVSVLLNLLLTLFFFSFFIDKMALFQLETAQKKSVGDYLVGSIFDSNWLPKTSQDTQKSAAGIIDVIMMKLQTWVKGYMWIIIIESIIYISCFVILGVPYAVILGLIAGCTVLLPFLGPLASCLITLIACIATGSVSAALLITIIAVYCIMNMVIEQLFLYPAFVGEALGLNILETIAVVLLGGLLAGLTGVIFAVPAASILKYLIPKVYNTVYPNTAGDSTVAGNS